MLKPLNSSRSVFLLFVILLAPKVVAQQSIVPFTEEQREAGRRMCDGALPPDAEVARFKHSETWFAARVVPRAGRVQTLALAESQLKRNLRFTANGKQYDVVDYLALNRVAGLLILKNGRIALEDYELGTGPTTHWPSFSIAKSVSSTLVGAALEDGLITSLDDALTKYVTALKGGAYDGVTVRNTLQMASGVKWDETYTDPHSDSRALFEEQFLQKPGSIIRYMSGLGRAGPPGSVWNYNTGETYIVGALLEAATHRPLATYLSQKIWSRVGMEDDGTWSLETPNGMGLGGTGLAATLRDYGRFGLMVQQNGIVDSRRIVPEGWFEESGSAKVIGGKPVSYGYLWWPLPEDDPIHQGAFQAIGIFGQHLYINPKQKLVIVVLSARPKPTGSTVIDDSLFFAAVAKALQ
jgi:CubicO group peptidase (beta-lactamase class C family)